MQDRKYVSLDKVLEMEWLNEKARAWLNERWEKRGYEYAGRKNLRGYDIYVCVAPTEIVLKDGSSSGSLSNWSAGWVVIQGEVEELGFERSSWSAGLAGGTCYRTTVRVQPHTIIRSWETNADGTETRNRLLVFVTEDEFKRL